MDHHKTFFGALKGLASYMDHQMNDIELKFDEKNEDFCAPEVLKSMLDVKKRTKTLQDSLTAEVNKSKSYGRLIDQILACGDTFLENQTTQISEVENYLMQYGFKPQEVPDNEPEPKEPEETETVLPANSVQSTPANFTKPSSRLNRTPQLEDAGLSEMTMKKLLAMEKKPHAEREVKTQQVTTSAITQHKTTECASNIAEKNCKSIKHRTHEGTQDAVEDKEREDLTFTKPKQTLNTKNLQSTVSVNKMPQIEDAGLSKMMMQRLEAMEKKQQVTRNVGVGKIMPPDHESVPSRFQHDGIICTPSLFGGKNMDRSVMDLHEALASPMHAGYSLPNSGRDFQEFDGNRKNFEIGRDFQPASINKTYTCPASTINTTFTAGMKENLSPTEPSLFTKGISHVTKEKGTEVNKKLSFDDMPQSPKLLGTYNYSFK